MESWVRVLISSDAHRHLSSDHRDTVLELKPRKSLQTLSAAQPARGLRGGDLDWAVHIRGPVQRAVFPLLSANSRLVSIHTNMQTATDAGGWNGVRARRNVGTIQT